MASPSLAELQRGLRRALTESRGLDAALRSPGARRASDWVAETPALGKRLRLAVYADAYFARLLATLEADFPTVRSALGEEEFRSLAAAYLQRHRPGTPNLADVGEGLPRFLRRHPLSLRRPWLSDLSALDHAVLLVLYSDRGPRLDGDALRRLPAERWASLRIRPSPALRLLRSGWDVDRVWTERGKGAPRRRPRRIAVWRDEVWARVERLPDDEASALESISRGGTLGSICERMARDARSAPPISRWFSRWATLGWLNLA